MATRYQPFVQRFYDKSGKPLNAGKVYFYKAGTYAALATYSDAALTKANPCPIPLSAQGYLQTDVYLGSDDYRVIVETSEGLREWDIDNVEAEIVGNLGAQIGSIWFFYGTASELSDLTDAGWFVCDGTNGTPDMLEAFVQGANSVRDAGISGGNTSVTPVATSADHSVTLDEMPKHYHQVLGDKVDNYPPPNPVAMGVDGDSSPDFELELRAAGDSDILTPLGSSTAHNHNPISFTSISTEPVYTGLIPIIYLGT